MKITTIEKKAYLFEEAEAIKLKHCLDYVWHRVKSNPPNEFMEKLLPFVEDMKDKLPNKLS